MIPTNGGRALVVLLAAGVVPPVAAREADGPFAAALERAAGGAWGHLRLLAECRERTGMASAELFGTGVGIWDGARQFALERERLVAVLRAADAAGFASMPASFGGAEARSERRPPRVSCRVALELDGLSKQVVQLVDGEQSDALHGLAQMVLDVSREPGQHGLAAPTLDDGLRLLAEGALAPEAFSLDLHRREETPAGTLGPGWQLRLRGRRAELQPTGGRAESGLLSADRLADLARALAAEEPGDLPINLYAEHYTDLGVRVLDRESRVLARRFAGKTPGTHGEAQERFDRILDLLLALQGRLSGEGEAGGEGQSVGESTSLR